MSAPGSDPGSESRLQRDGKAQCWLSRRGDRRGCVDQHRDAVGALVGNGDGDEEHFNARNIKYEAGNAVAYGMSYDDALRAITLTPAELFGLSDHVGSLQPGRDANLVVWSGDPFEFSTQVEHVFIKGREIKEKSRQDLLIDRYKPGGRR